ncbi:MAG: adenylate/guanylate cyclase domain-containing protein [Bdellovibrionota bacterium]
MSNLSSLKGNKLRRNVQKTMNFLDGMKKISPADRNLSEGISRFQNIVLGYFYFETQEEVDKSGRSDKAFLGLEEMAEKSAISGVIMPEGMELDKYGDFLQAKGLVPNIPYIANAAEHFAFFSNNADNDAVVRWVTLVKIINGNLMPSLSLKMAAEAMNRDIVVIFRERDIESIMLVDREDDSNSIEIPIDPHGMGRMVLNHRGPGESSFHHFSLSDAYHNTFTDKEKKMLKGSVLLLGGTAIGINDQRPNPFDAMIDGVEHHAAAIDNIMGQEFIKRPQDIWQLELGIILLIGLFFSPIMIWSRAAYSGILALLFLVGYYYFDKFYWFDKGVWVYIGMPFIEIITLFVGVTLYKYVVEEREKRKVQGAFAHYLSPEVIDEVLESDSLNLGGVRKECTVFFSDVRSFTTISESLSPEQLSQFMNEYFTPMTSIILKSKGCLDKYIGDAIMAFWGAPIPLENQADIAAKSSVEMLFALDKVQADFKAKNFPHVDIGIGLNTGQMSVGNMGSDERMAYTVMGDQVNLGARLEGLTKEYGIKIMISEHTVAAMKRKEDHLFRDLDDIRVKGKNEPTRVFELMRPDILPQESMIRELIGEFELGRDAYRAQNWVEAEKRMFNCIKIFPKDGPANVYLKRVAVSKKNPYIENWDGVHTYTHK